MSEDRFENETSRWASRIWSIQLVVLAAVCIAVLMVRARAFLPFIADDSLISLRYVDRLLDGKGLTWTDGERVEGYSNLLLILLTAGLAQIAPLDPIRAVRIVGLAGMAATILAVVYAYRAPRRSSRLAMLTGALVLAFSAPMAVWAIGGLEQGLVAPLVAWPIALLLRDPLPAGRRLDLAGLCLGLLCITRPDGPLLALGIGAGLLLGRPGALTTWVAAVRLGLLPLLFSAGQVAFRLHYYGDWVPNTAHAKLSLTAARLHLGLDYLTAGARAMPILPLGLFATALLLASRSARVRLLVPVFVLWAAYVASIGGDIFPAHRHLVVLIVVAAFMAAELTAWLAERPWPARIAWPLAIASTGLAALATCPPGRRDRDVANAIEERWEWEGKTVGESLAAAFADRAPLLAADAAGCLPYFSRLPALDMLGLNDSFIARHPPPDFGRGALAHELGDGNYVLSRKPDLILFCRERGAAEACFRSGHQMLANPSFARDHRLMRLRTRPPAALLATIWVRSEGKLGMQVDGDRVVVPPQLLSGADAAIVQVGADGQISAEVEDGTPARLGPVSLGRGRWRVTTTGEVEGRLLVRVRSSAGLLGEGIDSATLDLAADTIVEGDVTALLDARAQIRAVLFERLPESPAPRRARSSPPRQATKRAQRGT